MSHTPEPWHVDLYHNIMTPDGQLGLGGVKTHCTWGDGMRQDRANARRIVACVNACRDIPTAELEHFSKSPGSLKNAILVHSSFVSRFEVLEQQRDELLDALEQAKDMVSDWGMYASDYFKKKHDLDGDVAKLGFVIAKVKGGA